MRKGIARPGTESTVPMWESLERLVREKAQELIQQILEEVTNGQPPKSGKGSASLRSPKPLPVATSSGR